MHKTKANLELHQGRVGLGWKKPCFPPLFVLVSLWFHKCLWSQTIRCHNDFRNKTSCKKGHEFLSCHVTPWSQGHSQGPCRHLRIPICIFELNKSDTIKQSIQNVCPFRECERFNAGMKKKHNQLPYWLLVWSQKQICEMPWSVNMIEHAIVPWAKFQMLPSPAFPGSTATGRCWRNTKPGRCLILFDDTKHWMLQCFFR